MIGAGNGQGRRLEFTAGTPREGHARAVTAALDGWNPSVAVSPHQNNKRFAGSEDELTGIIPIFIDPLQSDALVTSPCARLVRFHGRVIGCQNLKSPIGKVSFDSNEHHVQFSAVSERLA